MIAVIVIVIILIVVFVNRNTIMEYTTNTWKRITGRTNHSLDDQLREELKLSDISENEVSSVEVHYKYRLNNSPLNRIVVVVADENSNAYMNNKQLRDELRNSGGVRSVVGYSVANSGNEMVRVIRTKNNTAEDPKVYIGSKEVPRVEEITETRGGDILDDI